MQINKFTIYFSITYIFLLSIIESSGLLLHDSSSLQQTAKDCYSIVYNSQMNQRIYIREIDQSTVLFWSTDKRIQFQHLKIYLSKIRNSILTERLQSAGHSIIADDKEKIRKYISCLIRTGSWEDILKI